LALSAITRHPGEIAAWAGTHQPVASASSAMVQNFMQASKKISLSQALRKSAGTR
jgi:hypothetical protein